MQILIAEFKVVFEILTFKVYTEFLGIKVKG